MLIEFRVSNFRSIRDAQTLSLVSGAGLEHRDTNSFETSNSAVPGLLHSAVLYGANAAGKSNVLGAVGFMQNLVLLSATGLQEGQPLNIVPFLMGEKTRSEPSEFEITFISGGVRYQYGFAATRERVFKEWLLAYPGPRVQRWFERTYNADTQKETWYFGPNFSGRKQLWQESTRSNALFLSIAVQFNSEQLRPIFDWFQNKLAVIASAQPLNLQFSVDQCTTDQGKLRVIEFMKAADLSIADINISKEKGKQFTINFDFAKPADQPAQSINEAEITVIKFAHQSEDETKPVELPFNQESDGTKRLFAFAGPWLDVLKNGKTLLVDELNASLHPLLVRYLVQLFHDRQMNSQHAQLVFSTHDTSILDIEIFRRDQIWFIEKDRGNTSHLYPLSDFSPRKGEALENGYLNGRYGALPFVGELHY